MDTAAEFRRHAHECEQMARTTRDPEGRATWARMAERWLRCARLAEAQGTAATAAHTIRYRKSKFTKAA